MGPTCGSGTCQCRRCTLDAYADTGGDNEYIENPFTPLAFGLRACQQSVSSCCPSGWKPKRLANELTILQQYFIEAHEQEVRHLQQLLTSAGVHVTVEAEEGCAINGPLEHPKEQKSKLEFAAEWYASCWEKENIDQPREEPERQLSQGTAITHVDSGELNRVKLVPPVVPDVMKEPEIDNDETNGGESIPRSKSTDNGDASKSAENGQSTTPSRLHQVKEDRLNSQVLTLTNSGSKERWALSHLSNQKERKTILDSNLTDIMNSIDGAMGHDDSEYPELRRSPSQWAYEITEHPYFDLMCGAVIFLNAGFMAYEVEYALTTSTDTAALPDWAETVSLCFTIYFTLELLLRMCGGLRRFFCTGNAWNYFDFFIVTFTVAEQFLKDVAGLANTRMIRLLRLTRTVKVLRVVRIIKVVTALRTLVNSLMGTIKQVIWAFFLIFCIIFVFSVIFGQLVSQARYTDDMSTAGDVLTLYWGTLPRCMYTLYMSVSGGVSWVDVARPLEEIGTLVVLGFLGYVALIQWVVLNVITGCFCESAAEAARKDVSIVVQNYRNDRDHFLQRCKAIFRSIDKDNSGAVEVTEMKPYLDSEPARALFAALDIDVGDVHQLFEMLDEDGDHLVDLDEFMWGCMNLRGGAKALGIAKLQCETKKIHKVLRGLVTAQKQTENLEKAIVMSEDGKTGGVVLLEKKKKSILKPAK
eukprot:TRINITY_DN10471_c1_g1_i1.p1 TRINITY_DN10471_c1_g1~~TRINITY_DN10471_c1_g1_i1.p1  ORF type:complete len:698 (-),score=113.80 TRINITY_DN10471_c1_g1_i1:207-2300(-)